MNTAVLSATASTVAITSSTTSERPTGRRRDCCRTRPARWSTRIARPAVTSRSALRSRDMNGSGRLLRGTAHAMFMAFCAAWTTPSAPYNAPSEPMITATLLPVRPSGPVS